MGSRNRGRTSLLPIAAALAACLYACPLLADATTSAPDSIAAGIGQFDPTSLDLGESWVNLADPSLSSGGDGVLADADWPGDATLPPGAAVDASAITITPEPATTSLLALGSVILLVSAAHKRRRSRSAKCQPPSAKCSSPDTRHPTPDPL